MKRFLNILLILICSLTLFVFCKSTTKVNDETVELTPEFILAVQKYDALGEFSEGLAPVGMFNDSFFWGYINTKGEEVIPCKMEADIVGCFSEGLACIVKDRMYSFIDKEGETVFTIDIPDAYVSEEEYGFHLLLKHALPYFKNGECKLRFMDDKVVVIDKAGKQLREEKYKEEVTPEEENGYLHFSDGDGYNKGGLKDDKGNIVIPARYDELIVNAEYGIALAVITEPTEDGLMPDWVVGYVDFKGHDTFPEQLKKAVQRIRKQEEETGPEAFTKAIQKAKWIESKEGFSYPDILGKYEFYDEEVPATYEIYSWQDVVLLSFCGFGVWATEDAYFPVKGSVIAKNSIVADVIYNYKSEIFSGHTTDGRIFYLKRIVGWPGEDIPHPYVLTLVYPKEYQDAVNPLIEIVRKWSNKK